MSKEQIIQVLEVGINDITNLRVDLNTVESRHNVAKLLLLVQQYLKNEYEVETVINSTLTSLGLKN